MVYVSVMYTWININNFALLIILDMRWQENVARRLLNSILLVVVVTFTSCIYVADYTVSLNKVERPADSKKPLGDIKVYDFLEDSVPKYRFEDDYIVVYWYVDETSFRFSLINKSGKTLKISWDDISYVDTEGQVGRVMHSGVKYSERNNSQPSTTIPKGATLSDRLIPTDNISYEEYAFFGESNWFETYLFPRISESSEESVKANAAKYAGKTMLILMPILIENVQNEYLFTFQIGVDSIKRKAINTLKSNHKIKLHDEI